MDKRDLIGQILMDQGYINLEQVNEARRTQMAYPGLKLGAILVAMEALSPDELEHGLKLQEGVKDLELDSRSLGIDDMTSPDTGFREKYGTPVAAPEGSCEIARKRIGQIMIEKGYATCEQVNEARKIQMYTQALPVPPLGVILRAMGYATGEQIEEALNLQEKLP